MEFEKEQPDCRPLLEWYSAHSDGNLWGTAVCGHTRHSQHTTTKESFVRFPKEECSLLYPPLSLTGLPLPTVAQDRIRQVLMTLWLCPPKPPRRTVAVAWECHDKIPLVEGRVGVFLCTGDLSTTDSWAQVCAVLCPSVHGEWVKKVEKMVAKWTLLLSWVTRLNKILNSVEIDSTCVWECLPSSLVQILFTRHSQSNKRFESGKWFFVGVVSKWKYYFFLSVVKSFWTKVKICVSLTELCCVSVTTKKRKEILQFADSCDSTDKSQTT